MVRRLAIGSVIATLVASGIVPAASAPKAPTACTARNLAHPVFQSSCEFKYSGKSLRLRGVCDPIYTTQFFNLPLPRVGQCSFSLYKLAWYSYQIGSQTHGYWYATQRLLECTTTSASCGATTTRSLTAGTRLRCVIQPGSSYSGRGILAACSSSP